ncbi:MAG TPA: hypothetical protein VME46_07350 [Acidimicrobiales bacterium]|nr:hypothetical protein [Acidimicrobiales bacterium]
MDQLRALLHREPTRPRRDLPDGVPVIDWRLRVLAPAVIAFTLVAAACGGTSARSGVASLGTTTTAAVTGGGTSGAAPDADFVRYATCMRSHGVLDFPDNPASPVLRTLKESGAMESPEFQAAAQACAKYSPPHASPPRITPDDQADYLRAATCMRNHGIAGFPDPVFSGGNVSFPIPNRMNTNSAQFRRAREICELLVPPGLPYSKSAEGGQ